LLDLSNRVLAELLCDEDLASIVMTGISSNRAQASSVFDVDDGRKTSRGQTQDDRDTTEATL
jgi:hypothetical protein